MTSNKSHEKVQEIPQHGFFGHPKRIRRSLFVEFWEIQLITE